MTTTCTWRCSSRDRNSSAPSNAADLTSRLSAEMPASTIARLDGRTISRKAPLHEALDAMTRAGRRRLAVTSDDSTLLGLLCLKASGAGFCSDADVANRGCTRDRQAVRCTERTPRSSRGRTTDPGKWRSRCGAAVKLEAGDYL